MSGIDHALVICDQGEDRDRLVVALLKCRLGPICCSNLQEARVLLLEKSFRVVLCGDSLSDGDFRAVLREVKKSTAHAPVIVLSHAAGWDSYLKALGAGAFDFIVCPLDAAEAERIIWAALADTVRPEEIAHAVA
jgi:DNA-binding NtrC family response regulator